MLYYRSRGTVKKKTTRPTWELNREPLDFKSSTLPNEPKTYPFSSVIVLVNSKPLQY